MCKLLHKCIAKCSESLAKQEGASFWGTWDWINVRARPVVSQLTTEVCKIKGMASQLSSIIDVNYLICLSSCRFPPCKHWKYSCGDFFFFFFPLTFYFHYLVLFSPHTCLNSFVWADSFSCFLVPCLIVCWFWGGLHEQTGWRHDTLQYSRKSFCTYFHIWWVTLVAEGCSCVRLDTCREEVISSFSSRSIPQLLAGVRLLSGWLMFLEKLFVSSLEKHLMTTPRIEIFHLLLCFFTIRPFYSWWVGRWVALFGQMWSSANIHTQHL